MISSRNNAVGLLVSFALFTGCDTNDWEEKGFKSQEQAEELLGMGYIDYAAYQTSLEEEVNSMMMNRSRDVRRYEELFLELERPVMRESALNGALVTLSQAFSWNGQAWTSESAEYVCNELVRIGEMATNQTSFDMAKNYVKMYCPDNNLGSAEEERVAEAEKEFQLHKAGFTKYIKGIYSQSSVGIVPYPALALLITAVAVDSTGTSASGSARFLYSLDHGSSLSDWHWGKPGSRAIKVIGLRYSIGNDSLSETIDGEPPYQLQPNIDLTFDDTLYLLTVTSEPAGTLPLKYDLSEAFPTSDKKAWLVHASEVLVESKQR